ncbi:MAG: multicopper oxidase domain-containing protein [Bryobacteraceae bacterium]
MIKKMLKAAGLMLSILGLFSVDGQAMIDGISGATAFNFTAKTDYITTPDGGRLLIWGYANQGGRAQYPGPTTIVNQGDTLTFTLANTLTVPVSIVFPGQEGVTAVTTGTTACANPGILTCEAPPGGSVTYSFTASRAGTYVYHSGTSAELQIEMGLVGALIVRPSLGMGYAYNHADTAFDRETLFVLTEMDPRIHELVAFQGLAALEATDYLTDYFPTYWFINGRAAPDTMSAANASWLPTQPYDCMPRMHPGERLLMRVIGAGRDLHPYHHHGNHARVIARDGRLLESAAGSGPDLSYQVFTIQSIPGETVDAIFEWTGKDLGWDIYGNLKAGPQYAHTCNGKALDDPSGATSPGYDPVTKEYCPDHGKDFPVTLPETQELTIGGFYSGSPYLGTLGSLPPGEGGMNPNAGFTFMWHSHTEKEMTNYDIFPGGMMTMLIIEPPGVHIH